MRGAPAVVMRWPAEGVASPAMTPAVPKMVRIPNPMKDRVAVVRRNCVKRCRALVLVDLSMPKGAIMSVLRIVPAATRACRSV